MQLKELFKEKREYMEEFDKRHYEKLVSLLQDCGLYEVDVIAKDTKGVLRVVDDNGYKEIKFYPYNKNGEISLKAKYVGFYIWSDNTDEEIKNKLLETFTPVKN